MANKNSVYVQSLVSFILDTKPYHSKLTEAVEEYQFFDTMNVHFDERTFKSNFAKAAWAYSHFANGSSAATTPVHQLSIPRFRPFTLNDKPLQNRGAFKAGRDENTDLPLVPYAFDPKSIQGTGISDAFIQRLGNAALNEPLLEGHDFFQSHGAFTFRVDQTISSIAVVTGVYQHAYTTADAPYPILVTLPFTSDALIIGATYSSTEMVVGQTYTIDIVGTSNFMLVGATSNTVGTTFVATGPTPGTGFVNSPSNATQVSLTQISVNGPGMTKVTGLSAAPNINPLFIETKNDGVAGAAITESGLLRYGGFITPKLMAVGVSGDASRSVYEEFTLEAMSPTTFHVSGSSSNLIGTASINPTVLSTALVAGITYTIVDVGTSDFMLIGATSNVVGTTFIATGPTPGTGVAATPAAFVTPQISFSLVPGAVPVVVGDIFTLTPLAEISVHPTAPLETWSLIKTNPLAYSRPVLSSTRYGYLINQLAVRDRVTILDNSLGTGSIVLTATNSTTFTLASTADLLYTGTVTVNVPYNDGRLAFTIVQGSAYTFTAGDKFSVEIYNAPAQAQNLDLYYGFDMDPFDGNNLVYNNVNALLDDYLKTLDFGFDSRFVNYDLAGFNLVVGQNAVDGRQWRLRALKNTDDLQLGNHVPTGQVNLLATDDPTNPNAVAQYISTNDVTSEGPQSATNPAGVNDLRLYYSSSFELEYYDDGTSTWISVSTVPVGSTYSNPVHDISFTLVPAAKPFIAAELNSSWNTITGGPFTETVFGGDVIAWSVINSTAVQTELATLISPRAPRLIMHGGSYQSAKPANWTLSWTAAGQYTLVGVDTIGSNAGLTFYTETVNLSDGQSYRNSTYGIHYTVVTGSVGLSPADSLAFTTYERKPTYLVHGSASGWQDPATVDEWYWNGKIGFKIAAPIVECFFNNNRLTAPWVISGVGTITLGGIRPDAPSMVYTLQAINAGHWMLYRDGKLVADGTTVIFDEYLTLTVPTAVAGTMVTFYVNGDEHALTMGHDLAIIKTTVGRSPTNNDFVLIERAEADAISISIKPIDTAHSIVLQQLAPITTDLRFVDYSTNNSGVPLSSTSPETAVLQGWIPALQTLYDSTTSLAEFKDPATSVVIRAAATGEAIGTVKSIGPTLSEPVQFQWDSAFATKYLPLNTEATIVTLGGGMNEHVNVYITDSVRIASSGGLLSANAMFNEDVSVGITDTYLSGITPGQSAPWWIKVSAVMVDNSVPAPSMVVGSVYTILYVGDTDFTLAGATSNTIGETFIVTDMPPAVVGTTGRVGTSTNVTINDGPFGGFLPGFGNTPYDLEDGVDGYFDAGQALVDNFLEAKSLALLNTPTPTQVARLNDLRARVDPYLTAGDPASTTLESFVTALSADPAINYTPVTDFGTPALGMGMDVNEASTASATTAIHESMVMTLVDAGYNFDAQTYDIGSLDMPPESYAILFSTDLPPVPNPEPVLSTYLALDTPLYMPAPGARVVDFSFGADFGPWTPIVKVWRPAETSPVSAIAEKIDSRVLRITLPTAAEAKFIIGSAAVPAMLKTVTAPTLGNATSISITMPLDITSNDLIVLVASGSPSVHLSGTVAGFTKAGGDWNPGGTGGAAVFYKIASGSEGGTSATLSTAPSSVNAALRIYVIRAGSYSTIGAPVQVISTYGFGTTNSVAAPTLTPSLGTRNYVFGGCAAFFGATATTGYPYPDNTSSTNGGYSMISSNKEIVASNSGIGNYMFVTSAFMNWIMLTWAVGAA